jgi:hypothetical protein
LEDTPDERRATIAASLKPKMLVLDFVGNSGKHKLMTAVDILSGNAKPEALDRARQKLKKSEDEEDVIESIAAAQAELDEEARAEEAKKKAEIARREKIKADRVKYRSDEVNPFSFWDDLGDRIDPIKKSEIATADQLKALKHKGVEDITNT